MATQQFDDGVEDVQKVVLSGRKVREHGPYGIFVGDEHLHFQPVVLADPTHTGRQILSASAKEPGEQYALFRLLPDGLLDEVRLDEAVDLRSAGAEKFLAFLTATIYRFQLNDKAMEWGAGRISGMTLKKLAGVDAKTHDLFQVIRGEETLVEDRALVDLTDPGLEHFATRVVNITIRVNTRPRQVHQRELGYWEIVRIAFPDAQPSQTALYTVTYSHGPRENPEGNLQPSHVVVLKNGMVFHVTPTDRS